MNYEKKIVSSKRFIVREALFSYQYLLIENGFDLNKILIIEQMMDDFDMRPFHEADVQQYMKCSIKKAQRWIKRLEAIGIIERLYGYQEKSYRFKSVFF